MDTGYEIGALYNRRKDIHARHGGQQQGGISTPPRSPFVFIFLGEAGKAHGYLDKIDDDRVLHYFGEGQFGDMQYVRGNLAIEDHERNGKRILAFQATGKGKPYKYLGEYRRRSSRPQPGSPGGKSGELRTSIVFELVPLSETFIALDPVSVLVSDVFSGPTDVERLTKVRMKQQLFRDRLLLVEKSCRLTGIADLRFLRASHIKPWSVCSDDERVSGHNGLLLSPQADHLFDRMWISFDPDARLLVSPNLPSSVRERLGIDLTPKRRCGRFAGMQSEFMAYHRERFFELIGDVQDRISSV